MRRILQDISSEKFLSNSKLRLSLSPSENSVARPLSLEKQNSYDTATRHTIQNSLLFFQVIAFFLCTLKFLLYLRETYHRSLTGFLYSFSGVLHLINGRWLRNPLFVCSFGIKAEKFKDPYNCVR